MTSTSDQIEIITSVQRRRRWGAAEKVRIVEETYEPGSTVSLVARRYGIAPNQVFTWRRLVAQGALTAAGAEEEVVPASDYRALQNQVRELHRLLGKKTLQAEILNEALAAACPKRMARPVCKRFSDLIGPVCINVSGLRGEPWPRWRSARPEPHKGAGIECHFAP